MPQHKGMQLTNDKTSVTPVRYQQYGITLKLIPNKDDMFKQTYNSMGLVKTLPQLWVCCANYGCNAVHDVSNSNDTQRNVHLSQHYMLGVTPQHGKEELHTERVGKMQEANTEDVMKQMSIHRLAQLRVVRFFIKKMLAFSVCEIKA